MTMISHASAPNSGARIIHLVSPPPSRAQASIDDTICRPFEAFDPAMLPRREFIYDNHYVRSYLSETISIADIGKSSLTVAEAIAMCTGIPLLGVAPVETVNVWLFNGEDSSTDLKRKIAAVCQFYRIDMRELQGSLFLGSGRERKIQLAKGRDAVINQADCDYVAQTISTRRIGAMVIDPFVTIHSVPENDNPAIEVVAEALAHIATSTNCAIDIVHHTRKVGDGVKVTADDARGAGALFAKSRSARTLNRLSLGQAVAAGVRARDYFYVTYEKFNLRRPNDAPDWRRFESVTIANGESVGVVTKAEKPDVLATVTVEDRLKAQEAIQAGEWRASPQAKEWAGIPIAQALNIDMTDKDAKRTLTAQVRAWTVAGFFAEQKRRDRNGKEIPFLVPVTAPDSPVPTTT
jgi:AAA domain